MGKTRKYNKCNFKNVTRKKLMRKFVLDKDFDLFNIVYNEPAKKDMAVGLVYFNSAKSKRLLMNYLYIREKFKIANIPTYTIEMYINKPEINDAIHVKTDFILFQKERLCYILEKHIPPHFNKLLFIDTDLIFDNINWYADLSNKLDTANIVQPFSNAIWLDITYRKIIKHCISIVFSMKFGNIHASGKFGGYHEGFAWAFQRDWYRKYGFFEYGILGGGDSFSYTTWMNKIHNSEFPDDKWQYVIPALKDYLNSIKEAPSMCYIKGNIYHLWHGDNKKRQYSRRQRIFNSLGDVRDIVQVDKNGLLKLKDDTYKSKILRYFKNRDDDGLEV